ncbi:MAG: hypothetical protein M3R36_19155 [Bacteroidota bacterium]|nr:hypothetical protein [Bacteroidota bacterium]
MNLYTSRLQSLEKIIGRLKRRIDFLNNKSNKYSSLRLIVFIAGIVMISFGFFISKETGWLMIILSLSSFSIVVHCHNRLLARIRRCYTYLKIKEDHLARMNIDWDRIPEPIINSSPDDMTTEKDLDLFGKNSLHNLIDVSVSYEGSLLLRKWITNYAPADLDGIIERQKIVKQLSELSQFRDKFLLKSKLVSKKFLECSRILDWVKNSSAVELPNWLLPVTSILITTYFILFILNILELSGSIYLLVFLIYFFVYSSQQKKLSKVIEESIELENQLKKFTALIIYIDKYSFEKSPDLEFFIKPLQSAEDNAAGKLKSLQKIISKLLIRENPIVRLIVNILFPYDIFFCKKLIKVKSEIETDITGWLKKLNELECYISLSNFSYLNPDYAFPEIETGRKNLFEVKSIGHPLIKRNVKVCNDFSFEKENEIVIITGSNMSGKSTFLRTAGINLCLAYAGAPINAAYFRTSLFELFTCIKVSDSVVDGISYFYAEVKKLKELLDEFKNGNGLPKFFLIDEIFKGTNNKERLIGSRSFIKKLAELKGTGFITTHDLELVYIDEEINSILNYHFREEIVNRKMEFDYKIHPGPCPTTNALKIMQLSGLPVE